MNRIQTEDCQKIGQSSFVDWKRFRGSAFLITGATGLIGQNLVNALAYNNNEKSLGIKLLIPVRNVEKAEKLFLWTGAEIIPYQLGSKFINHKQVDYIIHLASPTSSKCFSEYPVDTMMNNIEGTRALLNWAKENPVKKFIYLSSMEVYGFPVKGHKVKENELGSFETMNSRNSYPIGKIATENLCYAYYSQYGVPIVILRATQTFGPGVDYNDSRVFAQFMRCAVEKKDIILKSAGLTERSYLYTADCVSAILVGLLKAISGEAYTVANPNTYCSIKEMAELVAAQLAKGSIRVIYDIADDITKLGYAETLHMDLDITKIKALGWEPVTGLYDMYNRMIAGITE